MPHNSAIGLLKQLIEIPSLSRNEAALADFLFEYLTQRGLSPQRHENNLWCIAPGYDSARPTLLLNSHMDTVKPVDGWTLLPFVAPATESRVSGLGSNDAGASLVSLLEVFCLLSSEPQSYNLIFLASAEEEVSGANGIESVLPLLPPIALGVVGEPTDMRMAIAEKGLMVVDCLVHGQAGHAALNNGENAIYKSMEVIDQIKNFRFPKTSYLLGEVRMTVTMIQSGTQHNVIPDLCTFVIDIRTNELYTNQQIYDLLRQYLSCEVKPRSWRLNSSSIAISHPVVDRASKLNITTFGSPTLSDQALMAFPSVKMGPGNSLRSHTADEYIEKEEIAEAIDTYMKVLNHLSL